MAEYKREGRWITTDTGSHVFIKKGQTPKEAIEERFGGNEDKPLESHKDPNRKDKYGNPRASKEAIDIGVKAVKDYIEELGGSHEENKQSFVYLEGLKDRISDAITDAGLNPDFDLTYADFDEIIEKATGEKVDTELGETDRQKAWKNKPLEETNDNYKQKWNEDKIGKKEPEIQYEDFKGASAKFQKETNDKAVAAKNKLKSLNRPIPTNLDEADSMWQNVFKEYNKEPEQSNKVWDTKYQPIYDLYESIYDDFATKDYVEKMKKKGIKKPE